MLEELLYLPVGRPTGRTFLYTFDGPVDRRDATVGSLAISLTPELLDAYTHVWRSDDHRPHVPDDVMQTLRDFGLVIALPSDPMQGLRTIAHLTWVSTGVGIGNTEDPDAYQQFRVSVTSGSQPIILNRVEFLFWASGDGKQSIATIAQALRDRHQRISEIDSAIWHLVTQGIGLIGYLDRIPPRAP